MLKKKLLLSQYSDERSFFIKNYKVKIRSKYFEFINLFSKDKKIF